jgi:glutathione S-transferase
MVLYEKGAGIETREVDLENESEEFLAASPTGKVPMVVVDGGLLYESNVVNEYLDEVLDGQHLLPEDAKERARVIWMLSVDSNFYPTVFVANVGRELGFPEERVSEAREKSKATLARLEKECALALSDYPNVVA